MEYVLFVNKQGKLPKQAISDMQKEFISFAGKKIRIKVEKFVKKRSNLQNRWYWGVAVAYISEKTGYFPDEVHEFLKKKFLGVKEIKIGNESEEIPNSSAELTTTNFMGYKEQIQAWASTELNVNIPDPDENYKGDIEYLEDILGIKDNE